MSKTLEEIARQLSAPQLSKKTITEEKTTILPKEIDEIKPVPKVQLIYAFNGMGKTRLSREFKLLVAPKTDENEGSEDDDNLELSRSKILYYNAFTEDLFYWDNDLELDAESKLKIQPNTFTDWILKDQGQDRNIVANFQRYTSDKLTPRFNEEYTVKKDGKDVLVRAFSEVTFSLERGDDTHLQKLKISKGEESNFIWSVFYTLLEQVIGILNVVEPSERETDQFDKLEYVFIDDPVSSLDENHLIKLAVDLAELVKSSNSEIKFVITTHNPLFYNVLHNEFKRGERYRKYRLKMFDDGTFDLVNQPNDSPFSYHLFLKSEIDKAIESGQVNKYHFNFLRNILEKTSTYLGYKQWADMLPKVDGEKKNPYEARILNLSSHSRHAGEEAVDLTEEDTRVLRFLANDLDSRFHFQKIEG